MKLLLSLLFLLTPARADELIQTIADIKPSVVGIGSLQQMRGPAIGFVGTGFAVDDGLTVITAAHVVNDLINSGQSATLGVLIRAGDSA
ncbi:serine protease [Duganella radicis]|uniref:serine protease n=1 Tax=Duganella radicis TaxID=551988 RepID=UPI001E57D96E|nr:serine protease [Duganella radicis]